MLQILLLNKGKVGLMLQNLTANQGPFFDEDNGWGSLVFQIRVARREIVSIKSISAGAKQLAHCKDDAVCSFRDLRLHFGGAQHGKLCHFPRNVWGEFDVARVCSKVVFAVDL